MAMTAPDPNSVPGRVVGIDPGLNITGYAVIEPAPIPVQGRALAPLVVEAGVIRTKRETSLGERLDTIYRGVLAVLDDFPPSALALEQVHSQFKHPQTAILMAHARGVIVLAAARRGVPVTNYAATRIKKILTGSGKAPKQQIQYAIQTELGLSRLPEPNDVADACAVALCHFQIERHHRLFQSL